MNHLDVLGSRGGGMGGPRPIQAQVPLSSPLSAEETGALELASSSSNNPSHRLRKQQLAFTELQFARKSDDRTPPRTRPESAFARFPQELMLHIFVHSDAVACANLRASCTQANTVFYCFAWKYLQKQLGSLPSSSRTPFLSYRELVQQQRSLCASKASQYQVQRQEEFYKRRKALSDDPRPMSPETEEAVPDDDDDQEVEGGSEDADEVHPEHEEQEPNPLAINIQSPVHIGSEESVAAKVVPFEAPISMSPRQGSQQDSDKLRDVWLSEVALSRNIRHNFHEGRFNYTTVEKQSHAEPVVLPNGMICFTRWQLLAVFVRIPNGLPAHPERPADPAYPTRPMHHNQNRWAKAGYLPAHADTVTAMKYHRGSNTLITSAFDGVVKRWSIRDDFAPKEERDAAECLGLLATYQCEDPQQGVPAIFSFDLMDLSPPWITGGDDAFHAHASLIALGTEAGAVIIQLIDMDTSQQLGVFSSFDNRVRDVRFLNKHVFTEEFDSEDVQQGSLHLVACTLSNTYFVSLQIKRTRTEVQHPSNIDDLWSVGENSFRGEAEKAVGPRYGYTYEAIGEPSLLTPQVPFADTPSSIDVPPLHWPYPSEVSKYRIPSSRLTKTSFDNIPYLPKPEDCGVQLEADPERSLSFYRGNPFLTNPVVIFTFQESSCALASLNIHNPPLEGQTPTNSTALPYRWDALSADTLKATCAKWSSTNAFLGVGTHGGGVKLLVARPRQKVRSTGHHHGAQSSTTMAATGGSTTEPIPQPAAAGASILLDDSAPGASDRHDAGIAGGELVDDGLEVGSRAESDFVEHGSQASFGTYSDGASLLRSLTPSLGLRSDQDAFITEMLDARRGTEGAVEEDPSGFSCLKLRPIHTVPVNNLCITDTHLCSIDQHSTTHVYCLRTLTLAWYVTQHSGIPRAPSQRETLSEQIIALDACSHIYATRFVIVQNGTMLISPLVVTSHSLIADFTPLFKDPDAPDEPVQPSNEAVEMKGAHQNDTLDHHEFMIDDDQALSVGGGTTNSANAKQGKKYDKLASDHGILSTVDQRLLKDQRACKPRRIRAQKSIFSFHLAYVIFPPIAFLLIILVIMFLALAIEDRLAIPITAIVVLGEVFGVIPYFAGDVYCHEPMIIHMSGISFNCRVVADVCYLALFPLLYAMKMDGFFPFTHVSWVLLSVPLHLALMLALVAISLEIRSEVKHNIVLWRPTASGQRIFRMVNDITLIILASIFVVLMGLYFDGPTPVGATYPRIASLSLPELQLASHVFLPAWLLLLYGSLFLHKLINFNPDPHRLCRSWLTFLCTMALLLSLYLILLFLPLLGFCFKYDNYYQYAHWQPSTHISNATVSSIGDNTSMSSSSSSDSGAVRNDSSTSSWEAANVLAHSHRPSPSSYPSMHSFPLVVVLSPLMFFVLVLCVMTVVNAGVHYKQLVRYAHMLPEVNVQGRPAPAQGRS